MGARRAFARVFPAVLAAVLSFPAPGAPKSTASPEELRELRARLERAQRELAAAEESGVEARDGLRATERAVSEASRKLFALKEQAAVLESELEDIGRRARAAREGIGTQESAAERLLRLQYVQGAPDRLRLFVEGRDASQVARHLQYYGYIQQARAELIVKLRQGAQELEALEAEARTRREALARNRYDHEVEVRRMEADRRERLAAVERLSGEIAKGRREVGRLKRDEARLGRLVEELAKALARAPERPAGRRIDEVADASLSAKPFESLKGQLKLPVRGELAGRFGGPREEGGSTWRGLFIRAESGETVRAVADGRVAYADWLRGFGNLIILDHGKSYMSLYAYNEGLLRQVGDSVRSGDPIAQVGDSGGAGESGLYFELRHDGKPFDPLRWASR